MTTLTQIWMTFLLSNLQPSNHTSDLPMTKCELVFSILSQDSIDVAQLISDAIRQFVLLEPTRHPVDPAKANKALGFPALITSLCSFHSLPSIPSKPIRPPIDRIFIEKYCTAREPVHAPPVAAAPPILHPQRPSLDSLAAQMQRMELYLQHTTAQQTANHRGQVQIHTTLYQLQQDLQMPPAMTPEQFDAFLVWPGDRPIFPEGAAAPDQPADGDGDGDDPDDDDGDADMAQPEDDVI